MQQIEVTALRDFVADCVADVSAAGSAAGSASTAAAQGTAAVPLLLDVREPWEVALGTITVPGTTTLAWPMNSIPARLAELDPAQPIVCICHHGMRSAQVVAFLERQGMQAVYNLAGGTDAWSRLVDPGLPRY